jgi:hypothetical protein
MNRGLDRPAAVPLRTPPLEPPRREARALTSALAHVPAGGADRARTGDPLVANQVLSQLSYSPEAHEWWA